MTADVGGAPEPFGYKMSWLAIHSRDLAAVANALPLTEIREADWKEGIKSVYEHYTTDEVFITPPIRDWTLVVGLWTWGIGSRPERLIANLSKQFGEEYDRAASSHAEDDYDFWDGFWWRPNEETVMKVAGLWSVDPSSLGSDTLTSGHGLLAKASESPLVGNIAPSNE